ncbi:MAG: glycosyltransferase family 4 protein [Bacteroidetes bacterium]|nr:glycosyltransferase family 4 protein [Bacteroidota bacterium]
MRIALLTDGIQPYVLGGMQKHSFFLAKYLARQQVHVDLYHYTQEPVDDPLACFESSERPYIQSVLLEFPSLDRLPGHYIRESLQYSKIIAEELVKAEKPDFIYAKGFTAWHLLRENHLPAPVGVMFHGLEMFQKAFSIKSSLEQNMLKKPALECMQKADIVFSYGGLITELLLDLKIDRDKIIEAPSGVEGEWSRLDPLMINQPRKFIFTGRFEARKNIKQLYDVVSKLSGKEKFKIEFIGPIPDKNQIDIPEASFLGKLDQEYIKTKLDESDVLLCPSLSEGMPNVILEGMARGLAIIATDVGAVGLMVDDSNGWLLQPNSVIQLENAMKEAIHLNDQELLKKKENSLKRITTEFQWEQIIIDLLENIRKVKTHG